MLETIVRPDINIEKDIIDSDADFIVSDRLNYIGKLYKQIAQLDFSKPVLEALLRHNEESTKPETVAVTNKVIVKQVDNIVTVKPFGKSAVDQKGFIEPIMAYHTKLPQSDTFNRIAAGITYRVASTLYNFFSSHTTDTPVTQVFYLRTRDAIQEITSHVIELKSRLVYSHNAEMYDMHGHDFEDAVIDNASNEIIDNSINFILDNSNSVVVNRNNIVTSDDVIGSVAKCGTEFIKTTNMDYDYIILSKPLYAMVSGKIIKNKYDVALLFGKPLFISRNNSNSITLGVNPNKIRDYVSGYPVLVSGGLISTNRAISPVTFSPSLSIAARSAMAVIGDLNKTVITYKL